LTRSTEARYHAPVPTVVMRPVLWEVADIVEQIFRIACTEIHERAQVIALMRLYGRCWRPWEPEGRRARRPSR